LCLLRLLAENSSAVDLCILFKLGLRCRYPDSIFAPQAFFSAELSRGMIRFAHDLLRARLAYSLRVETRRMISYSARSR
jgi:hypothetical protein